MKPKITNRICAYPVLVAWAIGAAVLDIATIVAITANCPLSAALRQPGLVLILGFTLIPATLLGYFLGMFTCWPLIRIICSRYNGAPYKVGDKVLILAGPHKGATVDVYEVTTGQGGWELVRVDLGQHHKDKFKDILEVYSVLRIKMGEQTDAAGANLEQ